MKLRIKGNSMRLRISRSEMARLLADGFLEETIRFAPQAEARLTYVLAHRAEERGIRLEYLRETVGVWVSTAAVQQWAYGDDVGIYGAFDSGDGPVELMVEKDFACLDGEDEDAFRNPKAGMIC